MRRSRRDRETARYVACLLAATAMGAAHAAAREKGYTEDRGTVDTMGWQPKRRVIEAWSKKRPGVNFEESRVPDYRLPDPLTSTPV